MLLLLFLGAGGYFFYHGFGVALRTSRGVPARTARYTNDLIGVDTYTTKQFLRNKKLEETYEEAAAASGAEETAVVFRELSKGSWAEIRPDTRIPEEAVAEVLTIFEKYDARYRGQSIFEEVSKSPKTDSLGKPSYTIGLLNLLMRALYNGTYLGREESESALSRLAHASENMPSSFPPTLPFVSTSWEKSAEPEQTTDLHFERSKCGIGYNASRPFVLCIYAKGTNKESIAHFFQLIEERTYAELPFLYQ